MEAIKNTVFQVDSAIVKKARTLDNYIIETNEVAGTGPKICAIYFSSNFIYYPNNEASLSSAIFDKNRFEWWNLRHPKACKHIFIRDVYKQWYLHGINVELDSIEKLSDFLKKEIEGFDTYFIGSSAGGYAAVLLGSMLNAKRIYTFNNQFFLTDLLERSTALVDPIIFRERNNPAIAQFYFIKPYITNPSSIYYFHSATSDWDRRQYEEVKEVAMHVIAVNTNVHGIPLLKNNLLPLFAFSEELLKKLTEKRLNPLFFSLKIVGLFKTLEFIFSILPQIYNRVFLIPIKKILKA